MMWPKEIADLEEFKLFLVKHLNYDDQAGFSFFQIVLGTHLETISAMLGEPDTSYLESEQQQTLNYYAFIDHPVHGKRDHHKLDALFWAFHWKPLSIIRLYMDYYRTGESALAFHQFVDELFASVIKKFGKPDKKKSAKGNREIAYTRGKHMFFMWLNTEGIRVQIMSQG